MATCDGSVAQGWKFTLAKSFPPGSVPGQQSAFDYYRIENWTAPGLCLTPTMTWTGRCWTTFACGESPAQRRVFTQ
jgi:hypothetical protein